MSGDMIVDVHDLPTLRQVTTATLGEVWRG